MGSNLWSGPGLSATDIHRDIRRAKSAMEQARTVNESYPLLNESHPLSCAFKEELKELVKNAVADQLNIISTETGRPPMAKKQTANVDGGPVNRHKAMAMGKDIPVMKKGGKVEAKAEKSKKKGK